MNVLRLSSFSLVWECNLCVNKPNLMEYPVIEVLLYSEHVRTEVPVKSGFHCIMLKILSILFELLLCILNQCPNKMNSQSTKTYLPV